MEFVYKFSISYRKFGFFLLNGNGWFVNKIIWEFFLIVLGKMIIDLIIFMEFYKLCLGIFSFIIYICKGVVMCDFRDILFEVEKNGL